MSSHAFSFHAWPFTSGELVVTAFAGTEKLSRCYEFKLELVARDDELLDIDRCLTENAVLTIHSRDGEDRYVHGMVGAVWADGRVGGRWRYRAQLVPRLWLLNHRQDCRIFQEKTAVEIVVGILDAWKIAHREELHGPYPARSFCVQYRESDYAFVARLLADEGIWWRFEHHKDKHVLVLGDAPQSCAELPDRLYYAERSTIAARPYIYHFLLELSVQPSAVELSSYSFERPTLALDAAHKAEDGDTRLREAEHVDYPSPTEGRRRAKLRLEEHRCRAKVGKGESVCSDLAPGTTFELAHHPELSRKWLVVSIEHRGKQPAALGTQDARQDLYENTFACVPHDVPWRSRRRERPDMGTHTATVVGPKGEEICTDKYGRIKVQFHWDRQGKRNEKSSCWVRLSNDSAGEGWGALYLPRIGMEVIVQFVNGDPDRPLIIGTLYNGDNPPPLTLPAEKSKTVLRTRSTPNGGGGNEIIFEDAAGQEQFSIHAERDHVIEVKDDKSQSIGGNESLVVQKNRTKIIDGNHNASIARDDSAEMAGQQTITVTGNRKVEVSGDHKEKVAGSATELVTMARKHHVSLASTEDVALGKAVTVGGGYNVNVGAASLVEVSMGYQTRVIGMSTVRVGAFRKETIDEDKMVRVGCDNIVAIGKNLQRTVAGSERLEAGASVRHIVKGEAALAAKKFEFKADKLKISAAGGKCGLTIENGILSLWGENVTIDGTSGLKITGNKIEFRKG